MQTPLLLMQHDSALLSAESEEPTVGLSSLPPSTLIKIVQFLPTSCRLRVGRSSHRLLNAVQNTAAWHFAEPVPVPLSGLQNGSIPATSIVVQFAAIRCVNVQPAQELRARLPSLAHSSARPLLVSAAPEEARVTISSSSPPAPASASTSAHGADSRLDPSFWLMFGLLSLVLVLAESSRGVVIPTLALYQQSLGGSTTFLGVLVAIFSVGRLASSYVFGRYLSRGHKRAALTVNPMYTLNQSIITGLLFSLCVVILGHTFYIAADSGGLSLLLLARLLVGFGTGTLVLARTFVGDHVPTAQKSRFMAWLGIEQFVGFAFTPGLGSLTMNTYIGALHLTTFNFGSYLLAFLTLATAVGLCFVKQWMMKRERELQRNLSQIREASQSSTPEAEHSPDISLSPSPSPSPPPPFHHPAATTLQQQASLMVMPASNSEMLRQPLAHDDRSSASSSSASVIAPSPTITPPLPAHGRRRFVSKDSMGLWVLVFGNLVVRGSLSIAETFGSLIYFIVISPNDADQASDSARFFLGLGIGGVFVFFIVERLIKRLSARWSLLLGVFAAMFGYGLMMDFDNDLRGRSFVAGMIFVWSISSPISQTTIASQLSTELAARNKAAAARVGGVPPSQALWMGHLTAAGSIGRILFPLIGGVLYKPGNTGGVMLLCVLAHIIFAIWYIYLNYEQLSKDVRARLSELLIYFNQNELAFRVRREQVAVAEEVALTRIRANSLRPIAPSTWHS